MNVYYGFVIPDDAALPILPRVLGGGGTQLLVPVTSFVFNVAVSSQDVNFMYDVIGDFTPQVYPGLIESTICIGAPNYKRFISIWNWAC